MVGGIPELLSSEFLHLPKDYMDLSRHLVDIIANKEVMLRAAQENFEKAKEYYSDRLELTRDAFWKNITENLTQETEEDECYIT